MKSKLTENDLDYNTIFYIGNPSNITTTYANDKEIITITSDGEIKIDPNSTPTEAAQEFIRILGPQLKVYLTNETAPPSEDATPSPEEFSQAQMLVAKHITWQHGRMEIHQSDLAWSIARAITAAREAERGKLVLTGWGPPLGTNRKIQEERDNKIREAEREKCQAVVETARALVRVKWWVGAQVALAHALRDALAALDERG